MRVIDFPHRPRPERARRAIRTFELARQMARTRERQKSLVAEQRRLLRSLQQLERLAHEMEAIQVDLERLRAALGGPWGRT